MTAKTSSPVRAYIGLLFSVTLVLPGWAQTLPAAALPVDGVVTAGQAQIGQDGGRMTIQQDSAKAIIQWQGFDIGSAASVQFKQPDASSIALNRVMAGNASQIHGQLRANGQVWLVNPNGVVFGAGSKVNVGGLVASALETTDADFLAGKAVFTRGPAATGGITNQGGITAVGDGQGGGLVALLAPSVKNDGLIGARLGDVVLAAGDQVTLQAGADGLLQVAVEPAMVKTLVENRQLIMADGGRVLMTSKAADALSAGVVANTGTVQARTLAEKDGRILLLADMQHGKVLAAGSLQARFIETSAAALGIDRQLQVDTAGGRWVIDPVDITIDDNKAQAIEAALGTGDVTVTTTDVADSGSWGDGTNGTCTHAGDIHVNADITYAQNKLTLNADRHIDVNANISVQGTGTLDLNYGGTRGVSTARPTPDSRLYVAERVDFERAGENLLKINGQDFTVIHDLDALQRMETDLSGHYALGSAIDAAPASSLNQGAGFAPIGTSDAAFSGTFDGLGHAIHDLTINRPTHKEVGLFGHVRNATVRNVMLDGGSITGKNNVGALVGSLLAAEGEARISNVLSTALVKGEDQVGGLVGRSVAQAGMARISHAYATGNVEGFQNVGGLVGHQFADAEGISDIGDAYAGGEVSGFWHVGGLVGAHVAYAGGSARIDSSCSAADVYGGDHAGGLVGSQVARAGGTSSIVNAYGSGSVVGKLDVGGLVGQQVARDGGTIHIANAYATGNAAGVLDRGGLVGMAQGTVNVENSFYATTDAQGQEINRHASHALHEGKGRTLAEMKRLQTFKGWSIDAEGGSGRMWRMYEGATTPLLRTHLHPLTVTVDSTRVRSKVHDGLIVRGTAPYRTNTPGARLEGALQYASRSGSVGTYTVADGTLELGGLYSHQHGYDIMYADLSVHIIPAPQPPGVTRKRKASDMTPAID